MVDAVGGVEVAEAAAQEDREEETEEETEGEGSGSEAEDDEDAPGAGVLLAVMVVVLLLLELELELVVWGAAAPPAVGEDAEVEAPDGGALTGLLVSPPIMTPEGRWPSLGLFMRPPDCVRRWAVLIVIEFTDSVWCFFRSRSADPESPPDGDGDGDVDPMPAARALARSSMAGRSRGGGDSSSSRPRFEAETGGAMAVLCARVTRDSCACMRIERVAESPGQPVQVQVQVQFKDCLVSFGVGWLVLQPGLMAPLSTVYSFLFL